METIFMNSENSKTSDAQTFRLDLTDKLNLKDPKTWLKPIWVFITPGKTSSQNIATIDLKFQHELGMILLIYLMVLILLRAFKITLNLSSKTWNFDWKSASSNLPK